ncbi:MAG: riboflavin synthase [Elusimicrobia bacterium]|nr:riboflavin synthase [Elusimicrobiota bacterium]
MFTGIVETLGRVVSLKKKSDEFSLTVQSSFPSLSLGESISVEGICLTVARKKRAQEGIQFSADISEETWRKTNLREIQTGSPVNLERSLTLRSRLGGHFVQGHVDGVGEILKIESETRSKLFTFSYPRSLEPMIVTKGSISVSGVSLTIVCAAKRSFSVSLIPYTLRQTTLGQKKVGDKVNLESDILARVAAAQLKRKKG